MTLAEQYRQRKKPLISFELFPPRDPSPTSQNWAGIDKLLAAQPDYVSLTCGAGGSGSSVSTPTLKHLLEDGQVPVLAHLTCVGNNRDRMQRQIIDLLELGVRNFLALRGDGTPGPQAATDGEFLYAAQLVELIREVSNQELGSAAAVTIAVATYPAGSVSARLDAVSALADKALAGADFAITQVFYDVDHLVQLQEGAAYQGITLPIVPGVVPFLDTKRLAKLESLSGVKVPQSLRELGEIPDPEQRLRATVKATVEFLNQLLQLQVPGLHFFSFNRPRPVLDIVEHLRTRGFHGVQEEQNQELIDLVCSTMNRLNP